jgi:hypothetical protein
MRFFDENYAHADTGQAEPEAASMAIIRAFRDGFGAEQQKTA